MFIKAQNWIDINPKPQSLSARSALNPIHIFSGDDVIVKIEDILYPCRVVDIRIGSTGCSEILANIWTLESSIEESQNLPELDVIKYSNVNGMCGVAQSNLLKWVKQEEILDYAFIFHIDNVQCGQYANAHGMSNAYYTRFKAYYETNNESRKINVSTFTTYEHKSFSHLNQTIYFPESSHHRVFQYLSQMKQNADAVLWSKRKFNHANGIGRGAPLFISNEFWSYIINRFRKHKSFSNVDLSPNLTTRTVRTFFHDLSSQSVSLPNQKYTIVVESKKQFKFLRQVFGSSYGYGVKRPRDTKKSGVASLSITERINVVDYFSSGVDDGSRYVEEDALDAPEITNKIVFNFNSVTSFLTTRYYYRYVRVSSDRGQQLLREINQQIVMDGEGCRPIAEGSTFMFQGSVYRTLPHFAHMRNMNTINMVTGTQRTFIASEVRNLINLHNSTNDNNEDL